MESWCSIAVWPLSVLAAVVGGVALRVAYLDYKSRYHCRKWRRCAKAVECSGSDEEATRNANLIGHHVALMWAYHRAKRRPWIRIDESDPRFYVQPKETTNPL
jgi:hypothetical protein